MNNNLVIVAASISRTFTDFLVGKNYELVYDFENESHYHQAIGVVTSTKLILQESLLKKIPNLKWVARLGSGLEIIDMVYCQQHQIQVFNSPNGIANAVAEHAVAMLVGLQKNICTSFNQVQNGLWIREPNRGWELSGKTIGIIGYGATGQAFERKLSVFDMEILVYDIKKIAPKFGRAVSLEHLYKNVDIISYHVPLKAETKDYYNSNLFPKSHILLNTSRGPIANTRAILQGFESGKLIGACLDVLDFETIQPFTVKEQDQLQLLLQYPTIITPHIAGYSHNAIEKMCAELQSQLDNIH